MSHDSNQIGCPGFETGVKTLQEKEFLFYDVHNDNFIKKLSTIKIICCFVTILM